MSSVGGGTFGVVGGGTFGVVRPSVPVGYPAVVLADSPLAYWRLNEEVGGVAADEMGVASGVYVNAPTLGVPGAMPGSTAVEFLKSAAQGVDIPVDFSIVGTGPFSAEAWVKAPPDAGEGGLEVWLISQRQSGGNSGFQYSWDLTLIPSGRARIRLVLPGAVVREVVSDSDLFDDTWHHIVGVRESDGLTLRIYVDGVAKTAVTASTVSLTAKTGAIGYNRRDGNAYMTGTVDEVAVYDTALSPARIAAHYAAGS